MESDRHFHVPNTLSDQLDWANPEGDRFPFDLSKPLPLKGRLGHLTFVAEFFFNNNLEYLKSASLERKYTTSTTKTKAARYELVGSKMGEADINTLTMEQYLALTRRNQASGMVKPKITANVNFEIKRQFMRELREDTFSGNKNNDAYEHVERILDIVSLFNISGVTHDAVMLRAFIQRYCPPSKMVKKLEEIHNFKKEGDETLYQAWERYNDILYKFPTHDLNSNQKEPIPNKTPARALEEIQTLGDHSQKGHDGSTSRKISNGSSDGIVTITNKLDSLERDMNKLKENVHVIQVGCENCRGAHLNKDCPLHEEVKSIEEVKNQNASLKNLETHIDQLAKDYQANAANEVPDSSIGQFKAIFANDKEQGVETSSDGTNKLNRVSFISDDNVQVSRKTDEGLSEVLPCQLPLKELCPGSFTLPYTIGSMNLYAMEDLGAIVNIMLKLMFNHLKLTNLKETNMLLEMADMTKKAPMRIVKNVLVKIDKFIFPFDFMIIAMLGDPNETMILGRPFLATIHARIDVFNRETSLGVREDMIECNLDNERRNEKGKEMSFPDFLQIKYGNSKSDDTIKEIRIGKKKYILDDIWEKCEQVRGGTMYSWHNEGFEEEERWESGLDEKYYDPPQVYVEMFEVLATKK
ncbi:7-deoxyloganetin glucosyltransferase-like protein [Tanacetum coccineum]